MADPARRAWPKRCVHRSRRAQRFTHVFNGRFKGGHITRHYGQPADNIHALQIELAQSGYMDESGTAYDNERAAPLQALLQVLLETLLAVPAQGHMSTEHEPQSLEDAERRVRAALSVKPDAARLHEDLGTILFKQGRHAEAIPAFERALSLDSGLSHARKRLADALAACGRGEDADQHYTQYLDQDPDRRAIADGAEHLAAGRKSEAVAAFKAVLRRNPDHIDALRMLALALAGDAATADDAEALLSRVTALAPDYTTAWINLGALYVDQKKWVKGVETLSHCYAPRTRESHGLVGACKRAGTGHATRKKASLPTAARSN